MIFGKGKKEECEWCKGRWKRRLTTYRRDNRINYGVGWIRQCYNGVWVWLFAFPHRVRFRLGRSSSLHSIDSSIASWIAATKRKSQPNTCLLSLLLSLSVVALYELNRTWYFVIKYLHRLRKYILQFLISRTNHNSISSRSPLSLLRDFNQTQTIIVFFFCN